MFKFLKDKLKSWIKGSSEEIEKKAEAEQPAEELKIEKEVEKIEKTSKSHKVIESQDNSSIKLAEEKIKSSPIKTETQEIFNKDIPINQELHETEITLDKESEVQVNPLSEILEEEKPLQKSFFQKLKSTFSYKITEEDFNQIFDELELILLENNTALEVVEHLKLNLSKNLLEKEIPKNQIQNEIQKELKKALKEIIIEPDDPLEIINLKNEKPFTILFFGINGTGKTTSIAKITHLLKQNNLSVVIAAADTFRAASIEQISEHANKLQVPLIKHDYQSDPSAVGFDAIQYAKKHKIDVVLIDTAGRMHTKTNLLSEMEKIVRVTKPDLKIFVAESIAGNDAIEQSKAFHKAIGLDGSILSKADIDEKGGTILSISHATQKPIFYLGTGQNYQDLKLFNKEEFIESLGF